MPLSTFKTLVHAIRDVGFQAALRAVQYNVSLRTLNRHYAHRAAHGPFQTLGKVVNVEQRPREFIVQSEHGWIEIHPVSSEIVRVRVRAENDFLPPFSYAVDKVDWPPVALTCQDSGTLFTAQWEQTTCRVHKEDSRLVFEVEGQTVSDDLSGGLAWRGHEVRWTRHLPPEEACYGLGQRASSLDLRGKRLALWNADPMPAYGRDADPVYSSVPFYLGVRPGLAYGILWDNPARGKVDLGAADPGEMTFSAEDGELRYYLFTGPNVQAVLREYTSLTGRMPLPPIWALGFHQSRWGYDSEDVFRGLAQQFRQRRLPCDVLYFDIDYMDGYRPFTWNHERFALLPGLLADLEREGFKAVAILDPGIKIDPQYAAYQDGLRDDVFLKYPDGRLVTAPVWPGQCHFPDFTCAKTRAWWAERVAALAQAGFAGLWNDMNEPAVLTFQRGATLPDYVAHDWDSARQSHVGGGHNVYGTQMARATREGLQKQRPDKRPFVLTRASYAGAQRYCSAWTGDNGATWDHLRLSISMVLNAGLSGISFTGPDVGGFAGDPDAELYTRWVQLGSLLPYFRVHSAVGTSRREPWSFGERYETIIRRALEMRYQLLPYIYSSFAQCAQEGLPIVRPLLMSDPEDDNLRGLDDAFLLGDSILVAPVLEQGATQRELYLPRGVWYEFDTGKLIDGSRTITIPAPLERIPVYVRAGKTIPLWPVMQYVGEKPIEEPRLRVYAGSGESTIYEDAGEGLAYQRGEYRWSYFTCKFLPQAQFAIEWRRAGKYQPPYQQVRVEVVGISGEPEAVTLDSQSAPIWYYEGGVVEFIVPHFAEVRVVGKGYTATPASQTQPRPPQTS